MGRPVVSTRPSWPVLGAASLQVTGCIWARGRRPELRLEHERKTADQMTECLPESDTQLPGRSSCIRPPLGRAEHLQIMEKVFKADQLGWQCVCQNL